MLSELDRRYDEMLAKVTGPGGLLVLRSDAQGRAIVTNFPSTLPAFFRTFCAVNADKEALVAGNERLSFADLDRISERVAQGLVAKGVTKGDRVGIAMRNCPTWIVAYMAIAKAGGVATLLNGWWQPHEMEHAVGLTEPKLILADEQRAGRIAERCGKVAVVNLAIDRDIDEALASLLGIDESSAILPDVSADDDATILFTSGSTGECKGAVSTHRAVTAATYAYATGLIALRGLLEEDGRAPLTPPRTLLSVPLFHVTGEVPLMLNSFVIGRCMVVMAKWDAAEALRLIERERITYFVGRADHEPGTAESSRTGQFRPQLAQGHHRRRRAAPGRACRAAEARDPDSTARAWIWTYRNERGRLQQLLEQLCSKTRLHGTAAMALCRDRHPR